MALAIRLARYGCTNRPFYHIVVMQKHKGRNKKPLEQLGTFDPMPNKYGEKLVGINFERLQHWMATGAETTMPVAKVLGLAGYLPIHPMTYIDAERKKNAATKQALDQHEDQEKAESEAATNS